jgi:hypothetical protein
MTDLRQRGLRIDEPLAPRAPTPGATAPKDPQDGDSHTRPAELAAAAANGTPEHAAGTQRKRRPARRRAVSAPRATASPQHGSPGRPGPWRAWSGRSRVASYRLPDELLDELARMAEEHTLPVGLLVTAAITHLLDQDLPTIIALVDGAEDARVEGRRLARRRGDADRALQDQAHTSGQPDYAKEDTP